MRVLHVVKTSTGASWAWRLMAQLVRLGVDVEVALPPGGPMVARYRDAGVIVHELVVDPPLRQLRLYTSTLRELRALVQRVEPDIVHAHNVGPALALRLALGRHHSVPRIFQVPGPLHMEHAFFRRGELASAGSADYWLASCEYTRRLYLASGIPPSRISMSYYGTEVEEYEPDRHARGALRTELGYDDNTLIVGMVAYMYAPKYHLGQRHGLKGHEDLIDAIASIRRQRRDVIGVFVGGAWAGAHAYEARVREYGKSRCGLAAVFLGNRPDVARLYRDMDIAVHPSHSENVGGAVESMLMGTPTVATRVGGLPELVRPRDTGWLVNPNAPDDLSRALLEVIADRAGARRLALRGQELARQLFDVRRTAAEVVAEYERVRSQSGA